MIYYLCCKLPLPQKDQKIHQGLKESKSESSTVPTTKNIRRLLILTAPLASLQENLHRNQNSATQGLSSLYQMRLVCENHPKDNLTKSGDRK